MLQTGQKVGKENLTQKELLFDQNTICIMVYSDFLSLPVSYSESDISSAM